MNNKMSFKIPKLVSAFFLIGFLFLIGYVIPVTLTLGNQEIKNPDIAFNINLFSGLLFTLIGTAFLYYGKFIWKGDNKVGNSFGFFNIGEVFPFWKRFTAPQLTLYALIFFSAIFFISNALNFGGFTGAKFLPQQFSEIESIAFSTLLIPTSEEALAIFVVGMLVLGLTFLALKYPSISKNFKTFYLGVIPFLMGILAVIWHASAYPGSDVASFIVFGFWTLKTFLILAVGFVMIGVIMHMANNFFIDFPRLFSDSIVFGGTLVFIVVLSAITAFIYRGRILGKKT